MCVDSQELADSRQRIAVAYDTRLLKDTGVRLAELLATHLACVQRSERPVLPWV